MLRRRPRLEPQTLLESADPGVQGRTKDPQGADVMLSWRVVTAGGQILLLDPPQPGNVEP